MLKNVVLHAAFSLSIFLCLKIQKILKIFAAIKPQIIGLYQTLLHNSRISCHFLGPANTVMNLCQCPHFSLFCQVSFLEAEVLGQRVKERLLKYCQTVLQKRSLICILVRSTHVIISHFKKSNFKNFVNMESKQQIVTVLIYIPLILSEVKHLLYDY